MISSEEELVQAFLIYGQIGEELRKLGHDTQMNFQVDGVWRPFEITADMPGYGSYHSWNRDRPPKKLRIQVGDYGSKKQFPHRKAGFDFPKIAKAISEYVNIRLAAKRTDEECRAKDKKHSALLRKVAKKAGLEAIDGVVYGPLSVKSDYHGVHVTLSIRNITNEKALRNVIAKLQETGLISR